MWLSDVPIGDFTGGGAVSGMAVPLPIETTPNTYGLTGFWGRQANAIWSTVMMCGNIVLRLCRYAMGVAIAWRTKIGGGAVVVFCRFEALLLPHCYKTHY